MHYTIVGKNCNIHTLQGAGHSAWGMEFNWVKFVSIATDKETRRNGDKGNMSNPQLIWMLEIGN